MSTNLVLDRNTDDLSDESMASPERIAQLTEQLVNKMQHASKSIVRLNNQTRILSFNAQIEASRTGGPAGAAFGVVASAMRDLAERAAAISGTLEKETEAANASLQHIIETLATNVRGTRLSDLALTNIDLIDRNLYERSCDVRWWATDSSGVDALTAKTDDAYKFCSHRFGVILNSYTVYYDLVLCDLKGIVVANGRPNLYRSVGTDCSKATWFTSALATSSGEEFGFESTHESALVGGERVLVYSCCVREEGDVNGAPLGVLGIVFNWDALAQTIVTSTPLPSDEKAKTRVCIVDPSGLVLADSRGRALKDTIKLPNWEEIKRQDKGHCQVEYGGKALCVGFAHAPSFETYTTGWYSLLMQE